MARAESAAVSMADRMLTATLVSEGGLSADISACQQRRPAS